MSSIIIPRANVLTTALATWYLACVVALAENFQHLSPPKAAYLSVQVMILNQEKRLELIAQKP